MSETAALIASFFSELTVGQLKSFGFDIDMLPKHKQIELCKTWAQENEPEYFERLDDLPPSEQSHYCSILNYTDEKKDMIIESLEETVVIVCRSAVNDLMKQYAGENLAEIIGKNIDHILDDPRRS